MIQMPQLVALLNGIGGGASALVGFLSLQAMSLGIAPSENPLFSAGTSVLAILIGMMTLIGSLVAAGKLHKLLPQRPIVYPAHSFISNFCIGLSSALTIMVFMGYLEADALTVGVVTILSTLFGYFFAIRVGGADMPITISLLNSLSGLAGAIAGMATGDLLLVAIGGVVGASGLLLTQIMCRAMNRSLASILLGEGLNTSKPQPQATSKPQTATASARQEPTKQAEPERPTLGDILRSAREVIIVPGYGMALSQAQHEVRALANKLSGQGARVRYAIHPVAGRMPGHMNVLLAEADVDYE
ncbi:MAG: NAD(P)(+) transhydrogenase (Re/Si-specific) subunit beta, partial [Porphyromonadaceae bacterium]|nr:NAD(P)(+) transhydrogenase (Re/Si-specific) subunit beta [Porphyromonadaceae bacterium]